MSKLSKRLKNSLSLYDNTKEYTMHEAIALLKKLSVCKFDETVDVAIRLNVDPKKADQYLRGVVGMPNGTGKTVRVLVLAKGAKADEARASGADLVGEKELIDEIAAGRSLDFDVCIATPDMMISVGKVGKILGPKGLMPNPKTGTVTFDVAKAVAAVKKGQVEYKTEKTGIIHAGLAKISFTDEAIAENIKVFIDEILRVKPVSIKTNYVKSFYVSSSMGPSIRVSI